MLLAYNWNAVWQSVEDTWLPILIPIGIVIIVIIIIAVLKRNKDSNKLLILNLFYELYNIYKNCNISISFHCVVIFDSIYLTPIS